MTAREQLAEIYARIPDIACTGQCRESCGPILFERVERQAMRRYAPNQHPPKKADVLTCPALDVAFGRCTVYRDRPAVCRLFGVVEAMPCPFGCAPDRMLTAEEGRAILAAVRALSGNGKPVTFE